MASSADPTCGSNTRRAVHLLLSRFRSTKDLRARDVLARISRSRFPAFIFGGAIRDLCAPGKRRTPRDLDIVVRYANLSDLLRILEPHVVRQTRFGGLHLRSRDWLFDVWPIDDTWAIKQGLVQGRDFRDLTKTTFLDVEAVVAELSPLPGRQRRVYSYGFFEAMQRRTVDINLEENPYPSLCVVRSLVTAARLRFAIAPRLARYILREGKRAGLEELIEVQRSHYGCVPCPRSELARWIETIEAHLDRNSTSPVRSPQPDFRQLPLWADVVAGR